MDKLGSDNKPFRGQNAGFIGHEAAYGDTDEMAPGAVSVWQSKAVSFPPFGVPTRPEVLRRSNTRTKAHTTFRARSRTTNTLGGMAWLLILLAFVWVSPASAAFLNFQNCLEESYQQSNPQYLQFVPLFLNAKFNTTDPKHNLNITVWGNVTGSGATPDDLTILPSANDTAYWDSNSTVLGGKIEDNPFPNVPNPKLTTLFNKINVLTYEPWTESVEFCNQTINTTCPLGPVFNGNASDPEDFHAFSLSHEFFSTYAFASFTATILIKDGNQASTPIGCISANITPDLGTSLSGVLTFIPLVVLIFVGFATGYAAIFSPWGSTDTFRWTSNYGRDADLLRLVTPGFGDCLQYIQFIVLTGGLSLNYPGFYQPVVSKVSWSALMFNQSFVSNGPGAQSLVDGVYATTGSYGMDILRQLVGLNNVDDVWAGMAVWLLVIIGSILALIQIGFLLRWISRMVSNTQEEDLRAKNMPFSVGNVIRIVFSYFLLPAVALSMFQLVIASESPTYTVVLAVVMLVLIVGFAIWLLYFIVSTRPKANLFDDLPTVLLYGSLYNTYSDNAASFALIPVMMTFVRGVAIGAIQPSGIAQLVVLAICEVVTILTLHGFRPFHSPTSMNAYHTFFAVLRLATLLLMISFVPSLGVTEGPKGWIGYAILLMHAIVLIFGFLLNAIQTIVEVAARMAGAGGDESGAARGGLVKVFGMRQLSRRLPRNDVGSRQSQLSGAAMLDMEHDKRSYMDPGRMRSQSGGSVGNLLNRQSTGIDSSVDAFGAIPPQQLHSRGGAYTPPTPGAASTFSFLPSTAAPSGLGKNRGPILGIMTGDTADPYYRPPRARRPTIEAYSPGARSRGSWASGDWANRLSQHDSATNNEQAETDTFEGPSISGRVTPVGANPLDGNASDSRRSKADYTTREVDFYYGVRGPALNANIPSRRIKTGPADPTGPAASAAGWFKGLFGGKTKEKGKGFEVVRSSRMPPGMNARNVPTEAGVPEGIPVATGGIRNGPIDSDDDEPGPSNAEAAAAEEEDGVLVSPMGSDDGEDFEITRISDIPPIIPGIDISQSGIELPSRFPSKATSKGSVRKPKFSEMMDVPLVPEIPSDVPETPDVPRKSSRRKSQILEPQTESGPSRHGGSLSVGSARLPFERTTSHKRTSTISTRSSTTAAGENPSVLGSHAADVQEDRPTSVGYVNHHSIRTINPSQGQEHVGSSAIVEGRSSSSSSLEERRD